jgi:GNAT superfamily N-acetyltransferase
MESSDADLVADTHVRSQRAAYRSFMPIAYLDSPQREVEAREKWRQRLAAPIEDVEGWLTLVGRTPVGFAHVATAVPDGGDPVPAGLGYLSNIHLLPEHVGAGLGRPLFRHALSSMAAAGLAEGALWVYEPNLRARGFYEAMGWTQDGVSIERTFEWDGPAFPLVSLRYRGPTASR